MNRTTEQEQIVIRRVGKWRDAYLSSWKPEESPQYEALTLLSMYEAAKKERDAALQRATEAEAKLAALQQRITEAENMGLLKRRDKEEA